MSAIPHSSDVCSGMCRTPCKHAGCWQCEKVEADAERKLHTDDDCNEKCRVPCGHPSCKHCFNFTFKRNQKGKSVLASASPSQPIIRTSTVGWTPPPPTTKRDDQTIVTRTALDALCKRAGLKMDWNDGEPIIHDERGWQSAKSWSAETPVEQRVRSFDEQVRKLVDSKLMEDLQRSISDVERAKAKAAEEKVRQELRDTGASEADIEAAVALMSWKPEEK